MTTDVTMLTMINRYVDNYCGHIYNTDTCVKCDERKAEITDLVTTAVRRTIQVAPGPYQRSETDVNKIVAAVMGGKNE